MSDPIYNPEPGEIVVQQFRDGSGEPRVFCLENGEVKLLTWTQNTWLKEGSWCAEYGRQLEPEARRALLSHLLEAEGLDHTEIKIGRKMVFPVGRENYTPRFELPSPNLEPDEDGLICCPSCGREVTERDFGRADICQPCERGLT